MRCGFINKKACVILAFILSLIINLQASATQLPKPITEQILKIWPKASIRFDGLVELPDGTQYLPVFPINYANVQNPAEIVKTIPANTSIASEPSLILFANNFSLLKILKSDGEYTLISSDEIPLTVKLGLLPQDLIVPYKLVVPADLRIILGNLKIQVKDRPDPFIIQKGKNSEHKVGLVIPKSKISPELDNLVNKTFYTTNFKTNYLSIIDPQTGRSFKDLQLASYPSDEAVTSDGRYILVSCISSNKVSVVDTLNNILIKDLKVGSKPASITISKSASQAYVANSESSSISVIDLMNMEPVLEFKVPGSPAYLTLSQDEQDLIYYDSDAGNIYKVDLSSPDNISKIAVNFNTNEIAQFGDYLFVLSRIDSKLKVYNYSDNKLIKEIKVGNKPVDIKISEDKNKIYVLAAGDSALNIIDIPTLEITKTISFKEGSFPKNLSIINSGSSALITNIGSYELTYVDLDQEKVITYLPVNTPVSSLVITQQQR